MHRREALYRFHLDNECTSYEKVGSKTVAQEHSVIFDIDELLTLHRQSQPVQARREDRLVNGLE
jgi:hypothetical protein